MCGVEFVSFYLYFCLLCDAVAVDGVYCGDCRTGNVVVVVERC